MRSFLRRFSGRAQIAAETRPPIAGHGGRFLQVTSPAGRTYELSLAEEGHDDYHDHVGRGENRDAVWHFLSNFVGEGDVFFDVGANIGTLSVASAANGAAVHSFELLCENINHIIKSIKRNKLNNISIVQAAVGCSTDLVGVSGFSAWGHASDAGMIWVPGTSVDAYSRKRGIIKVDIIKIDVEGSEKDVLQGACETINCSHPDIIIESNILTCGGRGYSYRDLLRSLENFGYRIYRLSPAGITRWNNDWIQEVILTDYLATAKPEEDLIARSGLQLFKHSDDVVVQSIIEQGKHVPIHRHYVLAVRDRLPARIRSDKRITALLDRWSSELGAPPDVLRIGSA